MTYQNLHRQPTTARQRLIESAGAPFAPSAEVRPVVAVMDGRKRNDEIEPAAWRRALEAGEGTVAVYFELAADHEWWLAYDDGREYGEYEGPFHQWSRYPSGPWDHSCVPGGMLEQSLEDLYWVHDEPIDDCDIRRSRVLCLEDAPEFVQREVGDA